LASLSETGIRNLEILQNDARTSYSTMAAGAAREARIASALAEKKLG
jgi:DNA-binding Lrp family transcriptional regulator